MKLLTKTETIKETTVQNVVYCCVYMERVPKLINYRGVQLYISEQNVLLNFCPWCGEEISMEEEKNAR